MVRNGGSGKSRVQPEYNLDRVQDVAKNLAVEYLGRTTADTANLGLTLNDVCECICALKPENYRESKKYNEYQGWLDVYMINWPVNMAAYHGTEQLYIKFKLDRDLVYIELVSFHQSRNL